MTEDTLVFSGYRGQGTVSLRKQNTPIVLQWNANESLFGETRV